MTKQEKFEQTMSMIQEVVERAAEIERKTNSSKEGSAVVGSLITFLMIATVWSGDGGKEIVEKALRDFKRFVLEGPSGGLHFLAELQKESSLSDVAEVSKSGSAVSSGEFPPATGGSSTTLN